MLLAAANSMAMSLGRHRGAALIGRPLDLSVQAVLDAQDDISSLCLDADVFYADNKVDKSRVRVTAERVGAGTQDAVIRIRSSSLVDEPVVTMYVRVGCQQKTERRYVILADLVSEVVPDRNTPSLGAQQLQVSPPTVTAPSAALPAGSLAAAQSGAKSARKARKSTNSTNSANSDSAPDASVDLSRPVQTEKSPSLKSERIAGGATGKSNPAKRPRLKLEPLDLSIEREPQLKSSAELLSAPASNQQERSAAAALWRAIAAQPQDIMRDFDKLQNLETSVRGLQAQGQKTQQSINELGEKLQKAESERYANLLVYALSLFLLLTFAGLFYLLRERFMRRNLSDSDTPWWRRSESQKNLRQGWSVSADNDGFSDAHRDASAKKSNQAASVRSELAELSELAESEADLGFFRADLNAAKQNSHFGLDTVAPPASKHPDFAVSMTHPLRALKAEELFDVQQQADFFVSIGQHEQAIDVLRSHIGESAETSALVYLDLFNLYHQLQRQDDYAALREEFNSRFNTQIPQFDLYTTGGPGLEAYQLAMSRIQALWPSPKVLEIIEESIFRRPENNAEAFDLEAYRELLMLYSLAKEIISSKSKGAPKAKTFDLPPTNTDSADSLRIAFSSTDIQPLSASINDSPARPAASIDPLLAQTVPRASPNLGLDLDLSEPVAAAPTTLSVEMANVSNMTLFAQNGESVGAAVPTLDADLSAYEKSATNLNNLIDFDVFLSKSNDGETLKKP